MLRQNSCIEDSDYDLNKFIQARDFRMPGAVVDANVYRRSTKVQALLEKLGNEFDVVTVEFQEPFEPTYQYLDRLMGSQFLQKAIPTIDVWVGIRGGSTIDTAEGLAALFHNQGRQYGIINYRACAH
jgi:hypothetical protein